MGVSGAGHSEADAGRVRLLLLEAVDRVLGRVDEDDLHRREHLRPLLAEQAHGELAADDVLLHQRRLAVAVHQRRAAARAAASSATTDAEVMPLEVPSALGLTITG